MINLPKVNYIQFNLTLIVLFVFAFLVSSILVHNKNLSERKNILVPFSSISFFSEESNVLGSNTSNLSNLENNSNSTNSVSKISINSATKEQLMEVKGIGEKYAQSILDYIKEKGGVKSINELDNVKGIGPKTVEEIKKRFY